MDTISIEPLGDSHQTFLRDESRRSGTAESISFPASESDIRRILSEPGPRTTVNTIQGARTGIAGGAVPDGGHILNLSRMKRILGLRSTPDGEFIIRVEPGVVLADLIGALKSREFDTSGWSAESIAALGEMKSQSRPMFLPPDPTETSASIGGMVACNASGARTFQYGPTRRYVSSLRAVLADGAVIALSRGECAAQGRGFQFTTEDGRAIQGRLPRYRVPDVKNAAGYFVGDDMDLIDLFIGSEGTLGIITEIGLRLIPAPPCIWGLLVFLPGEDTALRLVRLVRGETVEEMRMTVPLRPASIEFFNHDALDLLRRYRKDAEAFSYLPQLAPEYDSAIYIEYHAATEDEITNVVAEVSDFLGDLGGSDESVWVADNEREMERFRKFRHAVPELVNLTIDQRRTVYPTLTKLGTDMSVPDRDLDMVMAMYRRDLEKAGLESVVFGHIGNNHVHVNILPRRPQEYDTGKALYHAWARQVVDMGGSVSAEHGIGKLKRDFLVTMYGEQGVAEMAALKRIFDPAGRLNRGNLFVP